MLQSEDFSRENWEAVTWRIVSVTYVSGYILSECLPPPMYFDWLQERMGQLSPVNIRLENTLGEEGTPLWKLTIRQTGAHSQKSP